MKENTAICLLNDPFLPQIDGVANAVINYAGHLTAKGHNPVVVTPSHPDAEDGKCPYPVLRYPSVAFRKTDGYNGGHPSCAGANSRERAPQSIAKRGLQIHIKYIYKGKNRL